MEEAWEEEYQFLLTYVLTIIFMILEANNSICQLNAFASIPNSFSVGISVRLVWTDAMHKEIAENFVEKKCELNSIR